MEGVVGIAGTPGTGKKSVAPLVAAKLGFACLGLNDLARSLGVLGAGGEVDTSLLKRKLNRLARSTVLYGHLLPYAVDRKVVSRMAVLRCEPSTLKRRLWKRGYSESKVVENVEAELIGIESADAFDHFGPGTTFEVDTTHLTPAESARKVLALLLENRRPGPRIDWAGAYDTGAKLRSLLSVAES